MGSSWSLTRRHRESLRRATAEALRLHQTHDAFATDRLAVLDQVLPNARAAIAALAGGMEGAHLRPQLVIALGPR